MQLAEFTVRGFADLLGSDAPAPGRRNPPPQTRNIGARLTRKVGCQNQGPNK